MAISVPYFTIKTKSDPGELVFWRRPTGKKQARLAGRYALEPDIDLKAFSCNAVIDWIVVCFWLGRKTQVQWLKRDVDSALRTNCHVDIHDEEPGGVSDKFDVRIQEPNLRKIRALCDALEVKFGLEIMPIVRAIEVSVDFKPKEPDDAARAKLYSALTRHFWTDRDVISRLYDRPRFTWGTKAEAAAEKKKKHDQVLMHFPNEEPCVNEHFLISTKHDRAPFVDANYYVGAKDADVRWRIMDKVVDRQNRSAGTSVRLDEADKRVRVEVTLDRPAVEQLGVTFLEDLPRMFSARLQGKFFKFMFPTFLDVGKTGRSRDAAIKLWHDQQRIQKFLKTGVIGLKAMDDARERQARRLRKRERGRLVSKELKMKLPPRIGTQKAGTFLAYDELNGRVSDALGELERRVGAAFSG
ncbi:hypothetical protein [Mesorhizobium sp. 8]|uniref:hypothetical protein n=1 Tax=Mesorhizobium sp. 8 TaxID=2584466 RepID=UPI00111F7B91|nr:hypothetical protein [Mesorhizobium sp. 8]QDC02311.1 hypothetical protein FGU64_18760 [Mesorhizobium sp. 8]